MASIPRRRLRVARATPQALTLPLGLGLLWLMLTGAASVDQLQRRIAMVEHRLSEVRAQERALVDRQEELSQSIKDLKIESKNRSSPFTGRKIESALQNLRSVIIERDALVRRAAELERDLDHQRNALRDSVRGEITRLIARSSPNDDTRRRVRALLDAYPQAPDVPTPPPLLRPPSLPADAEASAWLERATLLRNRREREDALVRRLEVTHSRLLDEFTLHNLIDDPAVVPAPRRLYVKHRLEAVWDRLVFHRGELQRLDLEIAEAEGRLPHTELRFLHDNAATRRP